MKKEEKTILIINICKEKLHYYEFVKPVEDIINEDYITKHYKDITRKDLEKADKIIICGTSLKDNEFMDNLGKFKWLKNFKKPVLGICGGAEIIELVLGKKLKRKTEIGLKKIDFGQGFLGVKGQKEVYHLHQFETEKEFFQVNNFYGVLFHPEVRNKEIVENFAKL